MVLYKKLRDLWRKGSPETDSLWKDRLIQWRTEPTSLRVKRPTRLDRARSLGYRAKQGIIVIRQRVIRGGRQREQFKSGRRPKRMRRKKILNKSYQSIAEERANKKHVNCEVLNSYYLAKDGRHYWYEVILIDKSHPSIVADRKLNWISSKKHTKRAFRGLTAASRKTREVITK
jgi:large subunit ribosomal protein L15e|tara:strand:- start:76 stop:597 length:522 start_codon:yes stop_codon:yes gene_type:complete